MLMDEGVIVVCGRMRGVYSTSEREIDMGRVVWDWQMVVSGVTGLG